jgi:leucyl/phenylalanyl-tRNA--protein transferase
VAVFYAGESLRRAGVQLFDVQFLTSHLASLGAREIPRTQYLESLRKHRALQLDLRELKLTSPVDS